MFLLIMVLAAVYGVGVGMVIAIWQMASEPCGHQQPPSAPVDELELKQSA
jgi:hypothetical protein